MNWNGLFGILSNDNEHAEYEDVYNENGDAVYCDNLYPGCITCPYGYVDGLSR